MKLRLFAESGIILVCMSIVLSFVL
jgi:hypothetical protein